MHEQQEVYEARLERLIRKHRHIPRSAIFYADTTQLYAWAAEDMLFRICKALEVSPMHVRIRLFQPPKEPQIDVQISKDWVKSKFGLVPVPDGELRRMVDTHVRAIVAMETDKFMKRWEKISTDLQRVTH
jgi:hypothetical protein